MILYSKDGGGKCLGNIGAHMGYMMLYPRRWQHYFSLYLGLGKLEYQPRGQPSWLKLIVFFRPSRQMLG
jgi:hypothetical protein